MATIEALTDRRAVEAALAECDAVGRFTFLEKYGFGEARDYFLVTDTGTYDSKAIFAAAYERQHGVRLTSDDFSGGKHGAAKWLSDLGYTIQGLDSKKDGSRSTRLKPPSTHSTLQWRTSLRPATS